MAKTKTTVGIINTVLEVEFSILRTFPGAENTAKIEVIRTTKKTSYFEQFYEMLRVPPVGGWTNEVLDNLFVRRSLMNKLEDKKEEEGVVVEIDAHELTQLQEANKAFSLGVMSIELAQMKKYIIGLKI